jgi:hypothetical protein
MNVREGIGGGGCLRRPVTSVFCGDYDRALHKRVLLPHIHRVPEAEHAEHRRQLPELDGNAAGARLFSGLTIAV